MAHGLLDGIRHEAFDRGVVREYHDAHGSQLTRAGQVPPDPLVSLLAIPKEELKTFPRATKEQFGNIKLHIRAHRVEES